MFALESEFIAWVYGCLTHSFEFIKREKAKTQKEIGKRACVCVCVCEVFGLSVNGSLRSPIPYILRVSEDLGVGTGERWLYTGPGSAWVWCQGRNPNPLECSWIQITQTTSAVRVTASSAKYEIPPSDLTGN